MDKWQRRVRTVEVGDTVGYSKSFLQSTSQYTGPAPFARGKVVALHPLGSDTILAEVAWDTADLPDRVNVKNLSTVRQIALGD